MNADKFLYPFFNRSNTTNDDYMKEFEAYIKVIESYWIKTTIHPGLVKSKLANMIVQDTNNQTQNKMIR